MLFIMKIFFFISFLFILVFLRDSEAGLTGSAQPCSGKTSCKVSSAVPKKSPLTIFVSFSLGDTTLKQLFHQAQKVNGRLVMRGLYKNSFKQTQRKIKDLRIIVDIDPPLFEEFNITDAPTFILPSSDGGDKVRGNIPLQRALEILAEAGNMEALLLLHKLKGAKDV